MKIARSVFYLVIFAALLVPSGGAGAVPLPAVRGGVNQNPPPAAPQAPDAVAYYNGPLQETTVINCASIIWGTPYTEAGFGTYVGFAADPAASLPGPGDVDYVHVVMAGIGNPCSGGTRAWVELGLPAGVSPAVDASNPIICYHNKVLLPAGQCPQALYNSTLHSGAFAYPSADAAHAYTWPLAQGETTELQIPILSNTALTNVPLVAYVHAIDGNASPWLAPQAGLYYFSSSPSIFYPTPSASQVSASAALTTASLFNHNQGGTLYFEIGTDTSYALASDSLVIPNAQVSNGYNDAWSGLSANTTYHWRARYVPNSGPEVSGSDQTFKTLSDGVVTVGDSGAGSACTPADLATALQTVGLTRLSFDCGSLPVTLALSSPVTVTTALTIDGGNKVTLQGANSFRLFDVKSGAALTLLNVELSGGFSGACGGAIYVEGGGMLSANTVRLRANQALNGAALCVDPGGAAALVSGVISGNAASANGGAIYAGGVLTISRTDISANSAGGLGGGVFNSGTLNLNTSLVAANTVPLDQVDTSTGGAGGGIYNSGTLNVNTSTISGNQASFGGGLYNAEGDVDLKSVTIASNFAQSGGSPALGPAAGGQLGGGIDSFSPAKAKGHVYLTRTLVAGNTSYVAPFVIQEANCAQGTTGPNGTVISLGYNLDGGNQCGLGGVTDLHNTNPRLGPLAYNGGWTRTQALAPGSPAIDAGPLSCGATDQRGFSNPVTVPAARPVAGGSKGYPYCDIGAFEYHPQLFLAVQRH